MVTCTSHRNNARRVLVVMGPRRGMRLHGVLKHVPCLITKWLVSNWSRWKRQEPLVQKVAFVMIQRPMCVSKRRNVRLRQTIECSAAPSISRNVSVKSELAATALLTEKAKRGVSERSAIQCMVGSNLRLRT